MTLQSDLWNKQDYRAAPEAYREVSDVELVEFAVGDRAKARALVSEFGSFGEVLYANETRLATEFNLNGHTISRLHIFRCMTARAQRCRLIGKPVLSSWTALLDYLTSTMGRLEREEFHVLYLDRKNALIKDETASEGTVDHAPVYPREILKRALELNASALILAHNHPSGDPTPSRADIEMTREICAGARALSIAVHDHVVVGRGGTASFKALGLLP